MRKTFKLKLKRISTLIDSFLKVMDEAGKLVDQEKFEEAEKLIDEILSRIDTNVYPLCNHILSFEEGVDEHWLNYLNDNKEINKDYEKYSVKFNYCPICGEKL